MYYHPSRWSLIIVMTDRQADTFLYSFWHSRSTTISHLSKDSDLQFYMSAIPFSKPVSNTGFPNTETGFDFLNTEYQHRNMYFIFLQYENLNFVMECSAKY